MSNPRKLVSNQGFFDTKPKVMAFYIKPKILSTKPKIFYIKPKKIGSKPKVFYINPKIFI